jgi:hypothetical protein
MSLSSLLVGLTASAAFAADTWQPRVEIYTVRFDRWSVDCSNLGGCNANRRVGKVNYSINVESGHQITFRVYQQCTGKTEVYERALAPPYQDRDDLRRRLTEPFDRKFCPSPRVPSDVAAEAADVIDFATRFASSRD